MPKYEGKARAPEFPDGADWLNVERPLQMSDLRGKVVLLDFWTYCCINCMHIISDLKRLEEKYADELVVIGVHSAKFTTERETENIRQAVLRYDIAHPVVNDGEMILWRQYGVTAWPTVVLVDPEGKVAAFTSGEGVYDALDALIGEMVEVFATRGIIRRGQLELKPERAQLQPAPLAFPGKVLADDASARLFVSDSNHNRIAVLSLERYSVVDVIGCGGGGCDDGAFERATFSNPQGMALDGSMLYIADTGNHMIRCADLAARKVTTIAGTGRQATRFNAAGPGKTTPISSPWDLVLVRGSLYIAMAGLHQLWRLVLASGEVRPHAGSGREARIDGRLLSAALAQPSGIATDGIRLYFADSETSSVRAADLTPDGIVETLVGGDLFDFGDNDGRGFEVRLQHPLGIAHHGGMLFVADTYNNKIKIVSIAEQTCTTFLGTGKAGCNNGDARKATFDEPGGLSIARGKLYIADTNNHLIRTADLQTGRVDTLETKGLAEPAPGPPAPAAAVESLEPGGGTLSVAIELPNGMKLNEQAPSMVWMLTSNAAVLSFYGRPEVTFSKPSFPIDVPLALSEGAARVVINFHIYYCGTGGDSLCHFREGKLAIMVEVKRGAGARRIKALIAV